MANYINNFKQNKYFLLFILLFAYLQTIYGRIQVRGNINLYTFTPEAAFAKLITVSILFTIFAFFIKRWQKSEIFSKSEIIKIFGSSTLVYFVVIHLFNLIIAIIFGNVNRNFNTSIFTLSSLDYLLDGFIYGSFIIAYYYYLKHKKHNEDLISYNKALLESRINQLKTQLNPHFLFNNLNVLDQLIYEDKYIASDFLNEFAEVYRYVLQVSDKNLVSIKEELAFAKQYFHLIEHKYGSAFQLKIEKSNDGFIVPLTLQILIENAIQHSLGTIENPVVIEINIAETICISNNYIPKKTLKPTSGRALENISEQYKLLTYQPIAIQKSDKMFAVIVPIIKSI